MQAQTKPGRLGKHDIPHGPTLRFRERLRAAVGDGAGRGVEGAGQSVAVVTAVVAGGEVTV